MFKNLLPKEEKYFENFREIITHIKEMSEKINQLFSADIHDKNVMLTLRPIQARCDEITAKVITRLNRTFITPFDREDVFALIKKLNAISTMLLGAAIRVETFNINHKIKYADKLSFIILQQIIELDKAIHHLKNKNVNEMKMVRTLETEADKIYQQAMKELFEETSDAILLIKNKEILDILENTSDKCQSAANVVLSIFIKYT